MSEHFLTIIGAGDGMHGRCGCGDWCRDGSDQDVLAELHQRHVVATDTQLTLDLALEHAG